MQQNQMNQQMNTFFIQGNNQNIFQQIRVPNTNMQWSVNNGMMTQLPNSISLSQPIQINQAGQRTQPMIINTVQNGINIAQRFISPTQMANPNQINQPLKINTIQSQIQPQQLQIQNQQPQIRNINQINQQQQRPQQQQQSIQIITDNGQMADRNINVTSVTTGGAGGASFRTEIKPEQKIENNPEDDNIIDSTHTINSRKLTQMVQSIDSHLLLDDELKAVFTQYMEEFLIQVTDDACKLAKLRNSNTLETKDFQYIMERDWGVYVPGYQAVTEKPKQSSENEIHRNRMNLIRKANR